MPATDYQGSFLGRISIRRNQVVSMDGSHEHELGNLDNFQKEISERFSHLLLLSEDSTSDNLLSVAWLRKLLDAFLCCDAQFKAIVITGSDPCQIFKPSLDRLILEFIDRLVKALDICNAVVQGVESVRQSQKLAQIAVFALEQRPLGDGQVNRAKKALNSLIHSIPIEDRDGVNNKSAERTWSFGRRGSSTSHKDHPPAQFRSVSSSVANGWSASRQIQAMSANLVAPRSGESSSLAQSLYMMNCVLVFVMTALAAAIPCQERSGLPTHFPLPRNMDWAQSINAVQEKITEEWKKKEKKGSSGLLEEMQRMEKLGVSLIDYADSFSLTDGLEEVAVEVAELAETCRKMESGLVPLQQQIREVFHRIVKTRTELLDLLDQSTKASAQTF